MTSAAGSGEDKGCEETKAREVLRPGDTTESGWCEGPVEQLLGTHPMCLWHLIN